jgi:ubiquinone biosynthesis protein UbiJ
MLPVLMLASVEKAVNAVISLDENTPIQLQQLSGKIIKLELSGLPFNLFIRVCADGQLNIMSAFEGEVDTTIKGAPFAIFRMKQGRTGEGLFGGDVVIEGQHGVGQSLQNILSELDIDWEEQLSKLTGDIVAHQIGNSVRGFKQWVSRSNATVLADVSEYIQHEVEMVPVQWEVDAFNRDVDVLRNDAERLSVKFAHLKNSLNKG